MLSGAVDHPHNRSTRTTSSRTRSRSAGCVSPGWGASSASQGSRSTSVSSCRRSWGGWALYRSTLRAVADRLSLSLPVFIRPSVGLSLPRSSFVRPPRPPCSLPCLIARPTRAFLRSLPQTQTNATKTKNSRQVDPSQPRRRPVRLCGPFFFFLLSPGSHGVRRREKSQSGLTAEY